MDNIKPMKARINLIPIWLLCALMLQALTSGAQPVTTIAAGYDHSLFLKSDGSLWATGNNAQGELGNGSVSNTNRPAEIVSGGITTIAAGSGDSLFLKSNGSLWAMGDNSWGQLGDGTYAYTGHHSSRRDCCKQRHGDCHRT
jgi:alpha-tubulin suppressor-like RCC1 family protein